MSDRLTVCGQRASVSGHRRRMDREGGVRRPPAGARQDLTYRTAMAQLPSHRHFPGAPFVRFAQKGSLGSFAALDIRQAACYNLLIAATCRRQTAHASGGRRDVLTDEQCFLGAVTAAETDRGTTGQTAQPK